MDALTLSLKASPEIYPFALDLAGDRVSLARLSRETLQVASFLDERALGPGVRLEAAPWTQVERAVADAGLAEGCGFIFHIGHVGSTLVSRLIGAHPGVLSLREPLPFRTLAEAFEGLDAPESLLGPDGFERRLSGLLKLWSRTFAPGQQTVVKATSFCSSMAEALLSRACAPRAVFMFAQAETYLATVFGGPNNLMDVRSMAESRLRRLHGRIGAPAWRLFEMSPGEMAAMSWAAEMSSLAAAAARRPGQALWLDFERFLLRPQRLLSEVFGALGVSAAEAEVAALVAGPEMGRYSKAPEHAYDSALRAQVLDQGRRLGRQEISRGLEWLERAAVDFPAIGQAVKAAAVG